MKYDKNVGIVAWGPYIPWNRLKREDVAKEWQSFGKGEKAVASYDEDSLTMATEAARNALRETNLKDSIEGLYFCSTTPPYLEKQSAATIAEVLELAENAMTVDITDSLRAGTQGMILASDNVRAGRVKIAMVCASDKRIGLPGGGAELSFGDGAAAFCIGQENVVAAMEGSYTIRQEILSLWRSDRDRYVRSYDERFGLEMGYKSVIPRAVSIALNKQGLKPSDISKVVIHAENPRHLKGLDRTMGFDEKTQFQDGFFPEIGNSGTAQVPLSLAGALEKSETGDRIMVVNFGDGCDVIIFKVTELMGKARKRMRTLSYYLKNKRCLPYLRYMRWRDLLPTEPPKRPRPEAPSPSALWRDNRSLALTGGKCKECGTVQYPAFRVCVDCGERDRIEPYRLADKIGQVVSFSHDNLAAGLDVPTTIAVIDFNNDGGRVMCDITDREPDEIEVGMPVEMTFRMLRYVGGIYDYWWKCKPVR